MLRWTSSLLGSSGWARSSTATWPSGSACHWCPSSPACRTWLCSTYRSVFPSAWLPSISIHCNAAASHRSEAEAKPIAQARADPVKPFEHCGANSANACHALCAALSIVVHCHSLTTSKDHGTKFGKPSRWAWKNRNTLNVLHLRATLLTTRASPTITPR